LADGIDPLEQKRERRAEQSAKAARQKTFRQTADDYLAAHGGGWSPKTQRGFAQRMRDHAFPILGALPVAKIDTPLVLKALKPVWESKPQTGIKVQQNIAAVLDFARAAHYRSGDNPAQWQGNLEFLLATVSKIAPTTHLAAMPYVEVPPFIAELRTVPGIPAKALEFSVLTAARSAEVFGAQWSEFDLQAGVWVVPSHRQKSRRDHRVPLSKQALALLRALPLEPDNAYVFIGSKARRPISEDALLRMLKTLRPDVTTHGFRSSFRDWAGERSAVPSEVVEGALAHRVGGATERAYFRSDLLEARARQMQLWADFCDAPPVTADVTPLRRA
jgi:integrase